MTEACHVSKHQQGRPAGTTGWWGIKCIWHNWFLLWCHDRTSSTDLASLLPLVQYPQWRAQTLLPGSFVECFNFKMHIQQCRNTVTWLVTIPLDMTRSSFMFLVYLVHQVYCIDCGTTAEKGTVRCLYHYSQERLVVCSLATAKGVHTSGGKL